MAMELNHILHIIMTRTCLPIVSMGNGAGDSVVVVSGGDCVEGGPARGRIEHMKLKLTLGLLVGSSN